MALAFLCVPIMLFGKPVHEMMSANKRKQYQQGVETGDVEEETEAKEGMGEAMITQAIHTIEYVWGLCRIPPHTCVCGHSHWRMRSYQQSYGSEC